MMLSVCVSMEVLLMFKIPTQFRNEFSIGKKYSLATAPFFHESDVIAKVKYQVGKISFRK